MQYHNEFINDNNENKNLIKNIQYVNNCEYLNFIFLNEIQGPT